MARATVFGKSDAYATFDRVFREATHHAQLCALCRNMRTRTPFRRNGLAAGDREAGRARIDFAFAGLTSQGAASAMIHDEPTLPRQPQRAPTPKSPPPPEHLVWSIAAFTRNKEGGVAYAGNPVSI